LDSVKRSILVTVVEAFEKYRPELEITTSEQNAASNRQKEIRQFLDGRFELEDDFLTGSYKRDTKTKPLKDVDIFCVLKATHATINKYRKQTASVVLQAFRDALIKKYGDKVSDQGRRSVSVDFGPDERFMSFDIVPAFAEKGHYVIPDTTTGRWIETDPTVHEEAATDKNKACDKKWKPLVKMVKGWNRHRDRGIRPSFLIEVMALDLVESPFTNYPYELQMFFANAAERIVDAWPDPAGLGPDVNDAMTAAEKTSAATALREAQSTAAHARRLAEAGREAEALKVWQGLLGPLFPVR
jgi:hypothetical protein